MITITNAELDSSALREQAVKVFLDAPVVDRSAVMITAMIPCTDNWLNFKAIKDKTWRKDSMLGIIKELDIVSVNAEVTLVARRLLSLDSMETLFLFLDGTAAKLLDLNVQNA